MDSSKKNLISWIRSARGESGIAYQRSAQITWWSILQGAAVAELVRQIPNIVDEITTSSHWYLLIYLLTSFMIVVNAWVQMAWAILISRWEINVLHTALILILGVSVSVTCTFVDQPQYWYPSAALLILSAISVYVYNLNNKTQLGLSEKRVKKIILKYVGFFILSVSASAHILISRKRFPHIVWGFVFLLATVWSLMMQCKQMKYERSQRHVP
jgi:hypothetical protein